MVESEEELKRLLMKVKEESEKAGLKLNTQKTKIMSSGPITSWERDAETVEAVSGFIFLSSKITADSDCSHEIKRHLLLGRKVMIDLDNVLKNSKCKKNTDFSFIFLKPGDEIVKKVHVFCPVFSSIFFFNLTDRFSGRFYWRFTFLGVHLGAFLACPLLWPLPVVCGDGERQGSLACRRPRGRKESDTTEWLNNFLRG